MKKIMIWALILLLVVMAGAGCQSQAPPETGSGEQSEKLEKQHIGITAGRPGDMWYVLSHALATFINERSDWLTAEVVATAGVTDNTRLLMGEQELRSNHLNVTMHPGATVWGEGEYMPLQIGMLGMLNETWVTLDPNIKTIKDFENKTVVLPRDAPYSYAWLFRNWIEQAGVKNVKLMHGGISARLTALRDGAAQVGVLPFDFYFPDEYALSASLMELGARGTLYFPNQGDISANLEQAANASRLDPFVDGKEQPPMSMVAPAGALDATQTEDMVYIGTPVFWSAGGEVPEDVVYEVTRILYEAAQNGDFAPYHSMGKGITPEFLTMSFWQSEEERKQYYHPGALRFYEEAGLELKAFTQ